jgi:phospholipid/cholesterol/gamma-HCH transport system permease protein
MQGAFLETKPDVGSLAISLKEDWVFGNVRALRHALNDVDLGDVEEVTFQCGGLQSIDIAGAWVLFRKSQVLQETGHHTEFKGFKAAHFKFLKNITGVSEDSEITDVAVSTPEAGRSRRLLESLGKAAASGLEDVGYIAHAIFEGAKKPSTLMVKETIRQIDQTGVKAIPIVFLMSFLMGVVMAYQGALQLEKFGATIFVVDLVTISVLREMGVVLAAIMVAGRSGSAFAASLGVMNLNEEIDALRVMGLNPNQVLVLPRILGLLIALPLLTVLSDLAGLAGGMLLSTTVLDIGATQFVERVISGADLKTFMVGFTKAPVFALLIAGVATLRGMQVRSSAEQLGRLTTVAVVQAIFLIILADGIFTVIFARYGI